MLVNGIGKAEGEEALLAWVVLPIVIALESEVVNLKEETEGAVVSVFDLEADAVAHRQFFGNGISLFDWVVGVGRVELTEEVAAEVDEDLVDIVKMDTKKSVEGGMVETGESVAVESAT